MSEEFKLNRSEIDSALWKKLEAHFNERIETYRSMNDNNLDPVETARVRAYINSYKRLLKLSDAGRETSGGA